ncbi:MAG: hypothetical protein MUF50_03280 [Planctomycetes bacterium]|jgi:hypothetical protein|nr:hypothetical protein [Planctomycetota bacterium]
MSNWLVFSLAVAILLSINWGGINHLLGSEASSLRDYIIIILSAVVMGIIVYIKLLWQTRHDNFKKENDLSAPLLNKNLTKISKPRRLK